jgi:capsular exopolysaccharide synthesis family protein
MAAVTPPSGADYEGTELRDTHLWDYLHVLLRRRKLILAVFLACGAYATFKTYMTRPVYEATAQLLIERTAPSVVSFKEVAEVNAGAWGDDYYQAQYKILQSRSLARKIIEVMDLFQDPEFGGPRPVQEVKQALAAAPGESPLVEGTIGAFLGRLKVQSGKSSQIVSVSFEAFRPELATRVANKTVQLYIQQSLEFRYQISAEAGAWLGGQIDEQRKKVEAAEIALQATREELGIVNMEEKQTLLQQKLAELGSALTSLKTARLEKEALYQQMKAAPRPDELPEVVHSGLVQSLRVEVTTLERQEAALLDRYLAGHPEVVRVRHQIAEARGKILSEAQRVIRSTENEWQALAAQEASVAAALEAAKAEALELSRRVIPYETRKREVEANKDVLNGLLARHKETDVAQELKASNIRILDAAVTPGAPVRPQRSRDITAGMLLGLALGIALAYFLDYLDSTLKTPEDVRHYLGVPLLGVIPEVKNAEGQLLAFQDEGQGAFREGYRVVRTALGYCWAGQDTRVLICTSTAPGEGKTLTSLNLALTLASIDGRVLLIDCDLRKPTAHGVLRLRRAPGLSDVLVGKASLEEAVRDVPGSSLKLLTSGSAVPSPGDLLTTEAMRGLVDGFRECYRWIVLDTPPVGAVADALVLSSLADGVVVVAGAEMVSRKAVLTTLHRIADTGARILGVVLNRAQIAKHSYYYGQYYGHYGPYGHYGEPPARRADAPQPTTIQ